MNTNFIVNDYVLIWNLLFGASISETIFNLKQKIWDTYRSEYNGIFKDKELIMKDYKNFIPNKNDKEIINQLRDKYKLKDKKVLGYVGRVSTEKNIFVGD